MILREIRRLREDFDVYTASVRPPDRPPERLTDEERDEVRRTYYVKPSGLAGALRALLPTLLLRPVGFLRGAFYALKLAGLRLKQIPLNVAYFTEAVMVGRWMARNDIGHLHTHYSSTVALLVHKTFGVPISISFHGPDEFNDPTAFWIREKVAASEFVRAISLYARSQLKRSCKIAEWDKIDVVYMGVDPDDFAPRPFRPNPAPLHIMTVGRLAPVKAQHVLLAALEKLIHTNPNVLLHMVGGGPERDSLEKATSDRGLQDHVVFHGFTPQERLEELYRDCDVFAMPSFAEGVPGVLMEVMAMEIPAVATWISGVPELVDNGINGLLVPPSDVDSFAEALRRLADDPELRLRLGKAARLKILREFDLRTNSAALADIFRRHITTGDARQPQANVLPNTSVSTRGR